MIFVSFLFLGKTTAQPPVGVGLEGTDEDMESVESDSSSDKLVVELSDSDTENKEDDDDDHKILAFAGGVVEVCEPKPDSVSSPVRSGKFKMDLPTNDAATAIPSASTVSEPGLIVPEKPGAVLVKVRVWFR